MPASTTSKDGKVTRNDTMAHARLDQRGMEPAISAYMSWVMGRNQTLLTTYKIDDITTNKVKLSQKLYLEALSDAEKVIELNTLSPLGYELKHGALHGAQRYDDAFVAFKILLSKLDNAPGAQVQESTEYTQLLYSSVMHGPLQMESITEAVTKYFNWAMLSHWWERKEPLLHDIQGKIIYDLDPVRTIVKLQQFCEVARDAGLRWAWSDTCCIDQNNNVELQESVNSMFTWYYYSEMERSTGISAQALAAFRPGMTGAREKLQWASTHVTTLQEDTAYSLFGIFGVHLPVIYGEKRQNALGRLLQEIIAHSGDISALDCVGKSSEFNSCLPADITSYKALPCVLPSLSEDEIQASVSTLRNTVAMESASKLYTILDNLSAPRFANCRLQLPCITFPVTQVRWKVSTRCTYDMKADKLQDLEVTMADTLTQFSPGSPTPQTSLLIRPWNRHDLGLPDFSDGTQSAGDWLEPPLTSDDPLGLSLVDNEPTDSQSHTRELSLLARLGQRFSALWLWQQRDDEPVDSQSRTRELRLIVRLGQPFGALLLAQQRGGEYKRIASDQNIIARVRDMASVGHMVDVRTLEIL
ncbi:uncharacterized protein BJ212DRAFT_1298171 [Suillus subaureus]|uniref:Heterokaryon incompatibility domain-containing protein n=1 Tax=Suillus subaureus TaxID=48587 RepID=A0A9P7JFS1_9AGAM|nr:uncharacterized protein BJ212DRAFT_1298171 [Suillus subaureus]KAG1819745.1 hypothetical protein BJ212DRAFT_1298171 [Suillus subaureus]